MARLQEANRALTCVWAFLYADFEGGVTTMISCTVIEVLRDYM